MNSQHDSMSSSPVGGPKAAAGRTVVVWDIAVRIFHWSLAVAFFVAYFTEDDLLTIHVWAGYTVGGLVVLRVIWGFVGPKHARFSDFLFGPLRVLRYTVELLTWRAKRHLGHSPAGGAMVIALLLILAATVWSGLETYAVENNAGPLAAWRTASSAAASGKASKSRERGGERDDDGAERAERNTAGEEGSRGGDFWEDVHEVLANTALILVLLHIAGVILASLVHRENLVRAMITGRKRAP